MSSKHSHKKSVNAAVIVSEKGGSGKTTTLVSLATYLTTVLGHNVVYVDLDPQGYGYAAITGEKPKKLSLTNRAKFVNLDERIRTSSIPQDIHNETRKFYEKWIKKAVHRFNNFLEEFKTEIEGFDCSGIIKQYEEPLIRAYEEGTQPDEIRGVFENAKQQIKEGYKDAWKQCEQLVSSLSSYMVQLPKARTLSHKKKLYDKIFRGVNQFYQNLRKLEVDLDKKHDAITEGRKPHMQSPPSFDIPTTYEERLAQEVIRGASRGFANLREKTGRFYKYLQDVQHPYEKIDEIPHHREASLRTVHLPIQLFFRDRFYIGDENYDSLIGELKSLAEEGNILLFDTPHFGSSDFFFKPIIELSDIISNLGVISITRDLPEERSNSKNCYEGTKKILGHAFKDKITPVHVCNFSLPMNIFLGKQEEYLRKNYPKGIDAYPTSHNALGLSSHGVPAIKFSVDDLLLMLISFNPEDISRLTSESYELDGDFFGEWYDKNPQKITELLRGRCQRLKQGEKQLQRRYEGFTTLPSLGKDFLVSSPSALLNFRDIYDNPIIYPRLQKNISVWGVSNIDFSFDWNQIAQRHYFHSIGEIAEKVLGK